VRKSINRRTALKSTVALAGVTAIGVASQAMASEPDPDAKLVTLYAEWQRAQAHVCEACVRADTIGRPESEVLLMDIPALEKAEEVAC